MAVIYHEPYLVPRFLPPGPLVLPPDPGALFLPGGAGPGKPAGPRAGHHLPQAPALGGHPPYRHGPAAAAPLYRQGGAFSVSVNPGTVGGLAGCTLDRNRPRATLSSFKRLAPLLRERAYVVLFPEGTYFRGAVGPGKHRLIQLLLKLQNREGLGLLPFVPVGLAYLPLARGCRVQVSLGPPLARRPTGAGLPSPPASWSRSPAFPGSKCPTLVCAPILVFQENLEKRSA